jgi:hypothetical protein
MKTCMRLWARKCLDGELQASRANSLRTIPDGVITRPDRHEAPHPRKDYWPQTTLTSFTLFTKVILWRTGEVCYVLHTFPSLLILPSLHLLLWLAFVCNDLVALVWYTACEVRTTLKMSFAFSTSLHFTSRHITSLHFTPLHSTAVHSTSLHATSLHWTFVMPLHVTPLHFTCYVTSFHSTSLHCTFVMPLHVTPLHFTCYVTSLHFTPLHSTSRHSTVLLSCHFTSLHSTLHVMSRHVTSRHFTSRYFTSRHVTSLHSKDAEETFSHTFLSVRTQRFSTQEITINTLIWVWVFQIVFFPMVKNSLKYTPLKRRCTSIKLDGSISQNAVIFIFTPWEPEVSQEYFPVGPKGQKPPLLHYSWNE